VLFDDERCNHQVRYLGLLENVRVRRAGFANRQPYERFLQRYKMLSSYTWPNHECGSDKDAVKALIENVGLDEDVAYGNSKIFIRTPKTLVFLEQRRNELIPHIIVLLQKMWRGALERRRFKRRKAVLMIMSQYRVYKMRSYLLEMSKRFQGVRQMRDLGKSIKWKPPPKVLIRLVEEMKSLHLRWRASQFIQRISPKELEEVRLRCVAYDLLHGKRKNWMHQQKWSGDYLALENSNAYQSSLNTIKKKSGFNRVIFSAHVRKVNKHNKNADRALLVTDRAIFKLDPGKGYKPMTKGVPLLKLRGMSVSVGSDQFLALHIDGADDIVVCMDKIEQDLIAEAVANISRLMKVQFQRELPVQVSAQLSCTLGGKPKTISIQPDNDTILPTFQKTSATTLRLSAPAF